MADNKTMVVYYRIKRNITNILIVKATKKKKKKHQYGTF